MRTLMITVLLATSVALPALAQDRSGRDRDRDAQSTEQRDEARAERRAQRAERAAQSADRGNDDARREARQQARQQPPSSKWRRAARSKRRPANAAAGASVVRTMTA